MDQRGSDSSNIEVEWQLDALDLRLVERFFAAEASGTGALLPSLPGLEASATGTKRLTDNYYDTSDWRIARSGHVLRTRQRGGRFEATLKDRAASTDGLRRRLEVTEPLGGEGIDTIDAVGPTGKKVKALVGGRPLVQVLQVRTRRTTFALRVHGADVGEVALDDTAIILGASAHRLRLQRVEVEVAPQWVESLGPLVERLRLECGLQPATLSKFEAGLLAAGVTIPREPSLGETAVSGDSTIGQLTYAVLRKDAASMIAHEPGTRLGDDPEQLHRMRVATRRMRAALSLFRDFLPVRAERVREELGWLAGLLGEVRDLDIQLERLAEWTENMSGDHQEALDELSDLLVHHREEARSQLLEALDSRRYERLVAALTQMLAAGPTRRLGPSQQPALVVLPDLIGGRHRRAVQAARRARKSGQLPDFHALRIRCKRLRYAVEFTGDIYPGEVKRYAKDIAGLQDALGLIQDAHAAAEKLQTTALGAEGASLPRSTVFAMGIIAERCAAEALARLGKLKAIKTTIDGPGWRRTAELLDDTRRAVITRAESEALKQHSSAADDDPVAVVLQRGRARSAFPGAQGTATHPQSRGNRHPSGSGPGAIGAAAAETRRRRTGEQAPADDGGGSIGNGALPVDPARNGTHAENPPTEIPRRETITPIRRRSAPS